MDIMKLIAEQVAKELGLPTRAKAVGTPTYGPPYSGTGLFSNCGFEDGVLTAFVGVGDSIIDDIPWYPTEYSDTRWEVITQVPEGGEAEPATDCEDCPTACLMSCWLHTCFGRYCRSSEEFSLERVFERNPGSQVRRLMGGITGAPQMLSWGNGQPLDVLDMLTVAAGYSLRYLLVQQAYVGNPGTTAPPGYEEMTGLQLMINTGLVDAFNGQACEALDSDVKAFVGCVGDEGASDITRMLAYIHRVTRYRAGRAGLDPSMLRPEIRMREEQWAEIIENWPALEYTRMGATAIESVNALGRLEEMRNRQALPIDGMWVPVKFDGGIPGEYAEAGETFTADIYYLNRFYGAEPLIYGEHLDFNVARNKMNAANAFAGFFESRNLKVTDGGRFLIVPDDEHGTCVNVSSIIRPRILVKAPWLQGRITDVCVRLLQPYPGPDYSGFVPGGHGLVDAPTFYGPCDNGNGNDR